MSDAGVVFWREGYDGGKSGHFVRAAALNRVVSEWITEGVKVAGILIDPENGSNIDVLIEREGK